MLGALRQDPHLYPAGGAPAASLDLRGFHVVDEPLSATPNLGRVVLVRRRVVPQLGVLDQAVRDVDAEPRDPAFEPEPQDLVERAVDVLGPPVEVRLLGKEVVQVVLTRGLVQLPRKRNERPAVV